MVRAGNDESKVDDIQKTAMENFNKLSSMSFAEKLLSGSSGFGTTQGSSVPNPTQPPVPPEEAARRAATIDMRQQKVSPSSEDQFVNKAVESVKKDVGLGPPPSEQDVASGIADLSKKMPRVGEKAPGVPRTQYNGQIQLLTEDELNQVPETMYNKIAPVVALPAVTKMSPEKRSRIIQALRFTPDDWQLLTQEADPRNSLGKSLVELQNSDYLPTDPAKVPIGGLYKDKDGNLTYRFK
jgi:hypothetical protein